MWTREGLCNSETTNLEQVVEGTVKLVVQEEESITRPVEWAFRPNIRASSNPA